MKFRIVLALVAMSFSPVSTLAYTNTQNNAVQAGREFYLANEDACVTDNTAEIAGTGSALTGIDNIDKAFQFFMRKGLTDEQSAGIIGNLIEESGVRPARQQGDPPNPSKFPKNTVGFGIAQWTFTGRQQPLVNLSKKRGLPNPADLGLQLDYMWIELNGSFKNALKEVKKAKSVEDAAFEFHRLYEISADTRAQIRERVVSGEKVLRNPNYGGSVRGNANSVPDGAATPSTGCKPSTDTTDSSTGGIVGTAMSKLTWPKPDCSQSAFGETRNGCKDPTKEYNAKGGTHTAPGADDAFTDCGIFVATVMHLSGADKKYPNVGTGTQLAYLKNHKDKYDINTNPKVANLQPGDVLVYDGHTEIFLGKEGGKYAQASASWHGHSPHLSGMGGVLDILKKPGVISARIKK